MTVNLLGRKVRASEQSIKGSGNFGADAVYDGRQRLQTKEPTFWLVSLRWSSDKFSKDEASFKPGHQMTELKTRIIKRIKSRESILVFLVVNDHGHTAFHQMSAAQRSKELSVRELAEIFRRNNLFAHGRAFV